MHVHVHTDLAELKILLQPAEVGNPEMMIMIIKVLRTLAQQGPHNKVCQQLFAQSCGPH